METKALKKQLGAAIAMVWWPPLRWALPRSHGS